MKKIDILLSLIIPSVFILDLYFLSCFISSMNEYHGIMAVVLFFVIIFLYIIWHKIEDKFYRKGVI